MTSPCHRDWAFSALLAAAFAMGFSMPAGRALLALAALLLAVDAARGRRRLVMPPSAWLWLLFVALAAVVTLHGVNPAKGLRRLDKLAWFIGLPLAATLADTRERLWQVVRALLLGLGVLALRVCVANPVAARATVEAFAGSRRPVGFTQALIDAGTLIDGQRLMVGLVGALALWLGRDARVRGGLSRVRLSLDDGGGRAASVRLPVWPVLLALLAAGELLALKRGSWFCSLALAAGLAGRRVSGRVLLLAALLLLAVAAGAPPVRQRLLDLRGELTGERGGRRVMWTQVAPGLLRDHPWGIGFRSLTPELMRQYAPRVEQRRDHLHSNIVETAVSVGWAGLALYLLWMAAIVRDAAAAGGAPRPLLWMVAALLLNGLVEYNFADAEIVVILGLLGGLAAAGRRLAAAPAGGSAA